MATDLQQTLRTLCLNTEWKYAVFWKLKHRARMVLTWEDAYYDNHDPHDPLEEKCFSKTLGSVHDGHYSHDALGLAVAKMSYHVYSLGEGIVGQVAVTGKHQWIFSEKHTTNSSPSFEYCDGWQSQFSAGIRTIVVVAVVPHGVVQLGSLKKVLEDVQLVSHIKDVFFALQDSSVTYIPRPIQCSVKSSLSSLAMSDISTRNSASEIVPDSLFNIDKGIHKERPNVWSPVLPIFGKYNDSSYVFELPGIHQNKAVDVFNKDGGLDLSSSLGDESTKFLQQRSENFVLEHQKQVQMELNSDTKCEGETSSWRDADMGSEFNDIPNPYNSFMQSINSFSATFAADKSRGNFVCLPFGFLDSVDCDKVPHGVDCHQNGVLHSPEPLDVQLQKDLEKKLEFQTELRHLSTSNTSLRFSAGSELHEALGPAFLKKSIYCDWETENAEVGTTTELPEGMNCSQLTSDSGSENLLEAVVAKVCQSGSDVKSEKSFCQSMQSLLTTEKIPEPSSQTMHTVGSAGYSIDQPSLVEEETQNCLKLSEVCGVTSSQGISSICPSSCSEQLDRSSEPSKVNKKRARPGESCRPRPRDRQLIQDRIKELRELVPNGSKCSIDSLLERTIKHMLFLQSITKHADKLNKCAESKLHNKETGMLGPSSYEQGSTWAVEVGSSMKVCPIVVENLNMDGQMVVEMLCEECSRFLEIAEAIRSLGLTILKGVTEACGEKTWIRFVVEGQNNRNMHRMEILWSLVQILQPKSTV